MLLRSFALWTLALAALALSLVGSGSGASGPHKRGGTLNGPAWMPESPFNVGGLANNATIAFRPFVSGLSAPVDIVNAGDGSHAHPTQALLDALTIRDRLGKLENLRVTILGDILHSRVARSNLHLLSKFGCRFTLCGPAMWLPREMESLGAEVRLTSSVDDALDGADAVIVLRVQEERLHEPALPLSEYILLYQLTPERLRRLTPEEEVTLPRGR